MTLEDSLNELTAQIKPADEEAKKAAAERQLSLTKPPGSLGRLEELSIQLAGIQGKAIPEIKDKAVFTLAGDHGVVAEGVNAYPAEVTPQMVMNMLAGGAAINVLARQSGMRQIVVDMGVAAELPAHPDLVDRKIRMGTDNIAAGPAMSREEALQTILAGAELVAAEAESGLDAVATGDMGIGNTTPSAAIGAAITGRVASEIVGRGTGVDDEGLRRKITAVERALETNQPDPSDGVDVLAKVGGFEIGGLVGIILGGAAHGCVVVVDGFISTAAALIAVTICPAAKDYMIAAHSSQEKGHQIMLDHLGLRPLVDFDLRLGEGSGAALAMPLIEASARIIAEMATFGEAGVSDKG